MGRVNSKKKGNRGELEICKILTNHFGQKFNRVPSSGAISTIHQLEKNSAKTLAGDIIVPDKFRFSIENKYGYDIDLYNLFQEDNGDKRKIKGFIQQAIEDAEKVEGIEPLFIYTRTRKKPLIGIKKAVLGGDLLSKLDQFILIKIEKDFNSDSEKIEEWVISDLNEFLRKLPKEFFFRES